MLCYARQRSGMPDVLCRGCIRPGPHMQHLPALSRVSCNSAAAPPSISSSKVRFDRPYIHPMALPGSETEAKLTVHQARFKEQGFASTGGCWRCFGNNRLQKESSLQNGTSEPAISALKATFTCCTAPFQTRLPTPSHATAAVWDSSIVLAKFFERQAATIEGKRCLDLSAGCGLPGLVLSRLGAGAVVATDLASNLPLLRKNAEANGGCICEGQGRPVGASEGCCSLCRRHHADNLQRNKPPHRRCPLRCRLRH